MEYGSLIRLEKKAAHIMRICTTGIELATTTIVSLLFWLAYCHYPYFPPLDAYGSRSSSGRRAPAVGLLAAGAVELQQVVDRVNYAAVGPAPERRNEKSVFPTLSASQAAAISSDEPGLLPFVAPTAVLTADPHKKNRTRYTPVSGIIMRGWIDKPDS